MKHRPKHVAEYLLLRAVCGAVAWLPYRPALLFACALARIGSALAADDDEFLHDRSRMRAQRFSKKPRHSGRRSKSSSPRA